MSRPNRRSILSGPKAPHIKAWAGASRTNAGPGKPAPKIRSPKGRNKIHAGHVPPLQGGEIILGTIIWSLTPRCHIEGFRPSQQRRFVAELDVRKCRQGDTATIVEETLPGIVNVKAFANGSYELTRSG